MQDPRDETIDAISDALMPLLGAVRQRLTRAAREQGLSLVGVVVLSEIEQGTNVRAKDLVEKSSVETSVMSRQITALEEQGLIERSADPHDGRARVLELTPEGAAALRALRGARRELLHDAFDSWGEGDLRDALKTIRAVGGALTKDKLVGNMQEDEKQDKKTAPEEEAK